MDLFILAIIMLVAVLLSVVINKYVPKISTPLIQIVLGVLISIFVTTDMMSFDTDLFLLVFISPILFNDGFELDKRRFWDQKWPILSLAIGLVFAIVLIVGFLTHVIVPSIPLAAAFAFAAALGPTDPIAVAAVTKRVPISERQETLFAGEALLNDASSLVSFQFALAAVVTGTFSALSAVSATAISFIGGIVVGIALMYIRGLIMRFIDNIGFDDPAFATVFEVITPFLVFIIAESLHVSEIIAVVAAGIMYSLSFTRRATRDAQDTMVANSVWHTLTFALNSVVFVMMGILLPQVIPAVWENPAIPNWRLLVFVVAITLILYLVRFVWVLFIKTNDDNKSELPKKDFVKSKIRSSLVLTLGGAKGVVTFAIAMSIPQMLITGDPFPERQLILFLSSGVILLSLLVANFILPMLLPAPESESVIKSKEAEELIELYGKIITNLATKRTDDNANAINSLVNHYNGKISDLRSEHDIDAEKHDEINKMLIAWERENVLSMIGRMEINPIPGYSFVIALDKTQARLVGQLFAIRLPLYVIRCCKHFHAIRKANSASKKMEGEAAHWPKLACKEQSFSDAWYETIQKIRHSNRKNAIQRIDALLEEPENRDFTTDDELMYLRQSYENKVINFVEATSIGKFIPGNEAFIFARYTEGDDAELEDYAIRAERVGIRRLEETGKISKETARKLRSKIAMKELDIEL